MYIHVNKNILKRTYSEKKFLLLHSLQYYLQQLKSGNNRNRELVFSLPQYGLEVGRDRIGVPSGGGCGIGPLYV